ncbi:MAG TPA: LysR family transcriptional regulator, partial [Candidatus Limiplasma sp.]|nr:LysR family transcriptional regulator [Candidatus Limiplasma sp.]
MNIQHLRYAVEVEKTRSITEAAENLYMSQPNLSRGIRELEGVLGITIFDRTPKGIVPTAQGEEFLHYASSILAQFDEMTERYSQKSARRRMLRLSVPRSSYIAQAFARFAQLADPSLTLDYKETNALRSIRNVTEDGYDLGIVRFQADYEKYFTDTFREKGLQYRELWSFRYLAMLLVCALAVASLL